MFSSITRDPTKIFHWIESFLTPSQTSMCSPVIRVFFVGVATLELELLVDVLFFFVDFLRMVCLVVLLSMSIDFFGFVGSYIQTLINIYTVIFFYSQIFLFSGFGIGTKPFPQSVVVIQQVSCHRFEKFVVTGFSDLAITNFFLLDPQYYQQFFLGH
jgi:hypothetical protein